MTAIESLYENAKELKVLYIEDEKELLNQSKLIFDNFFKIVDTAQDGSQALNKYTNFYDENQSYYDLVISDIEMPKINGVELSKHILNQNEEQVIIILSAHEDTHYLTQLINIGINFFIPKPLEFDSIVNVFSKSCENIKNTKLAKKYLNETEKKNNILVSVNEELEQKIRERTLELENQLYYDKLTSLLSQHALLRDLEYTKNPTLIIVNIDSFQNYNNLYNFEVGNEILLQFAQRLHHFNQNREYKLYRLYSDNFALLKSNEHPNIFEINHELTTLKNDISSFNYFINLFKDYINIDVTIGISINEKKPILCADMALRHAKSHNLEFAIYEDTHDLTNTFKSNHEWTKRIKKALEMNNVVPVYQPIVDKNQKILKHEVLMRIAESQNGKVRLISPYLFLEEAIKSKQYNKLATKIINKSFDAMKKLTTDFSINLSYEDIYNRTLLEIIKNKLDSDPQLGSRLIIEILESDNIDDFEVMNQFIEEFRKYGVRIAIDDFGAGYSNYTHLLSLNPDYIKIDGSLIKHINTDKKSFAITKAIIHSAKELNIKIIAEFVHSKEVFDIVYDLGVDEFQGYYFSEPLFYPKE